jgi:hypothetical protein
MGIDFGSNCLRRVPMSANDSSQLTGRYLSDAESQRKGADFLGGTPLARGSVHLFEVLVFSHLDNRQAAP